MQNNMYIDGRKEDPRDVGNTSLYGVENNSNLMPTVGEVVLLDSEYREYYPDLSAKDYRPVSYEGLRGSDQKEVEEAVNWVTDNVGWFHSVELRKGIFTPGGQGWAQRKIIFDIEKLVVGKTVLDIGSMEGGDVFCAESCGAKSVTACDVDNYLQYDLGKNAAKTFIVKKHIEAKNKGLEAEWIFLNSKKFGFELCRAARGSEATRISSSIYDLCPEKHGTYDIVCCFGLFYHLRHPLLALERVYEMANEMAFINNQTFSGATLDPHTILFHNDTWAGSYTNWFVPTPKMFIDMASSVGFCRIEVVYVNEKSTSLICYK